jgi:hypothetical protein
MLRNLCLLFLMFFGGVSLSKAQLIKEFKVTQTKGFELAVVEFTSYKSTTNLKRIRSTDPLYIHGHLEKTNILPVFSYSISNNVLTAALVHKNVESENLGKSITSKIFSSSSMDFDHTWDLGLTTNFLYHLDFTLGMGRSDFDLANLNINQLKIKSASADVHVHYSSESPNQVQMDTLHVTLNMGTVTLDKVNFTNAKKIIVEVNYGKINLDFSDGMSNGSQVIAVVGAGTLNLTLPSDSYPIKIKMKTTPMCRVTLPKYFKALGDDTYVTRGYKDSDPRRIELTIDVGVGSITVE